ncbi:MAG: hypothetical protein VR64_16765 [Desulfatitalea sp. BRH_c12]|nr:MAG: hypothetical protein VR64_16765 [Desulfatitalea sp. BRH_c12]
MKINPNDAVPASSTTGTKTRIDPAAPSFANVLEKTFVTPQASPTTRSLVVQSIARPAALSAATQLFQGTTRTLDAMETYQRLLADGTQSLRAVEPAVRHLQKELADLASLMPTVPDGNPAKEIALQTMVTAATEITRFEEGAYVA